MHVKYAPVTEVTKGIVMTSYNGCLLVRRGDHHWNWLSPDPKHFNDTHREKLCFTQFSTRIYWNRGLAVSDLFRVFTQSVKFYAVHSVVAYYKVQMFKQNDS